MTDKKAVEKGEVVSSTALFNDNFSANTIVVLEPELSFGVDTGQFVAGDVSALEKIEQDEFVDVRLPHHKPTGEPIDRKYLGNWQGVIAPYGKTLNELNEAGELDMRISPEFIDSEALSYSNISVCTMYTKNSAKILQGSVAASTTAHGDGMYYVYKNTANSIFVVLTDLPPKCDDSEYWPSAMTLGAIMDVSKDGVTGTGKVSRVLLGKITMSEFGVTDPCMSVDNGVTCVAGEYEVTQLVHHDKYEGRAYDIIMGMELRLIK